MDTTQASEFQTMLSGLDFTVLATYYLDVVKVGIPVVVSILALKKGIGWILGMVRRA